MNQRADAFFRAVAEAVEGTPYVVTRTESGFDLTVDIVDARWWGVLTLNRLSKVFIHHVAMKGADRYTITDDSRTVDWRAGVPTLSTSGQRQYGRVIRFSAGHIRTPLGQEVATYAFSSEEGRGIITSAAGRLGLRQRWPASMIAGAVVAGVAGGGVLVGLGLQLAGWI